MSYAAPGRFLKPHQVAAELAISVRSAYRLAEKIGTRIEGCPRIEREALETWLAQQKQSSSVQILPTGTRGSLTPGLVKASRAPRSVGPKATQPHGVDAPCSLTKIRPIRLGA